jgi:hypothetical protein
MTGETSVLPSSCGLGRREEVLLRSSVMRGRSAWPRLQHSESRFVSFRALPGEEVMLTKSMSDDLLTTVEIPRSNSPGLAASPDPLRQSPSRLRLRRCDSQRLAWLFTVVLPRRCTWQKERDPSDKRQIGILAVFGAGHRWPGLSSRSANTYSPDRKPPQRRGCCCP